MCVVGGKKIRLNAPNTKGKKHVPKLRMPGLSDFPWMRKYVPYAKEAEKKRKK